MAGEFEVIIQENMSTIVDLLKHKDGDVRSASVTTVGKLAKHRESSHTLCLFTKLIRLSAAFQKSIQNSVPWIVELFKDSDRELRLASIRAMDRLVEKGKGVCFFSYDLSH
jgi:hypothetical protein